ncbi:hypothetical protein FJ661_14585 [Pseudarthrobacter phenanthrenivorans]|uniref:glycosyltransferase n=1 Tax=Pseudarthrobacter phenanthrenivorans TaxID=361575 RepID=UPI001126AD3D|nr:glycosyltransferase [Pseudarthrobacter phenanthrenivorans]TPV49819.1 hypothetical protein FJ661_14585 [Pseudarthrobacter phenanthrenivorans]
MLENVNHVLLTRFNVPSSGYESVVRARDGWLRNRVSLFEQYCLPSVRSQLDKNFQWIIYFDPESPPWMKERIRDLNRDDLFIPIYRTEVLKIHLICDLRATVGTEAGYLLTTNLDNDDGLAADFTARLRSMQAPDRTTAVYMPQGLIRSGGAVYRRTDPKNAFCSVIAPWPVAETCWAEWHNQLGRSMPVVYLDGPPAWLQVIHGSNVSNRIHGTRVSPARFSDSFPRLLEDLVEPTTAQLLADRAVGFPLRLVRDAGRMAAKAAVQSILGRHGIDKVKAAAASWRTIPPNS